MGCWLSHLSQPLAFPAFPSPFSCRQVVLPNAAGNTLPTWCLRALPSHLLLTVTPPHLNAPPPPRRQDAQAQVSSAAGRTPQAMHLPECTSRRSVASCHASHMSMPPPSQARRASPSTERCRAHPTSEASACVCTNLTSSLLSLPPTPISHARRGSPSTESSRVHPPSEASACVCTNLTSLLLPPPPFSSTHRQDAEAQVQSAAGRALQAGHLPAGVHHSAQEAQLRQQEGGASAAEQRHQGHCIHPRCVCL